MEKCVREYGDIFEVKLNYLIVFISYLKVIEEIFKVNFKKFDCGSSNKLV